MAVLHLQDVTYDLVRRIEQLTERVRQTPEEIIVELPIPPCTRRLLKAGFGGLNWIA